MNKQQPKRKRTTSQASGIKRALTSRFSAVEKTTVTIKQEAGLKNSLTAPGTVEKGSEQGV